MVENGRKQGVNLSEISAIEWTDSTWNPVRGCTKVSPGCKHCYALTFAERWRGVPGHPYEQGFDLRLVPHKLEEPLKWKTPRRIFVNSMSDLFHDDVPLSYIQRVFAIAKRAPWHTFQILTKRAERLAALAPRLPWPANLWQGVSVENQRYLDRIAALRRVPAAIRFLSLEPLLGPLPAIPLDGISWVIVGGESGLKHRLVEPAWVLEIRDQCVAAGVPFFFKQWGGRTPKAGGRLLDGREWNQMPVLAAASGRAAAPGI
jgi:protein gp37